MALRLSSARIELGVKTRLLKVPVNEATPSPLGKLPGGTDEVNTDVPTRLEFSNAWRLRLPLGEKAVAKLNETPVKFDEKLIVTGPVCGGLQKSWISAFPDKPLKLPVLTLQTEAGPVNDAVSPLTVLVNGDIVPAVTLSKVKIASALAGTAESTDKESKEIERRFVMFIILLGVPQ